MVSRRQFLSGSGAALLGAAMVSKAGAASLPEAGGPLCRYFDPDSLASAVAAIAATLDDRPGLAAWEARIRTEFQPTPWTATVRALLTALDALDAAPTA